MDKPLIQPTPLTVRQIAALMDIKPKSTNRPITTMVGIKERGFSESASLGRAYPDRPAIARVYYDVAEAAQFVAYVATTGRLPAAATLRLRETTAYRACKIIAAVRDAMPSMEGMDRSRARTRCGAHH